MRNVGYQDRHFAGCRSLCMPAHSIPELILSLAFQIVGHQRAVRAGYNTCLLKLALDSGQTALKINRQGIAVGWQVEAEEIVHITGRARVDEFQRARRQRRTEDSEYSFHGTYGGWVGQQEGAFGWWQGMQFEIGFDDEAKRSQRANVELVQVVTGHVFDHASAAARYFPVCLHHLQADHEVAGRTIAQPFGAEGIGGQDTAYGG